MNRMPPLRPNPLGDLLRKRRRVRGVGHDQIKAATGYGRETIRKWEVGQTYDVPLRETLLYAEQLGLSLEEVVVAALGRPYSPLGPTAPPEAEASDAAAAGVVADAARVLPAQPRERKPGASAPRSRRASRPSPE